MRHYILAPQRLLAVSKSDKQVLLERQGCVFAGQERLDNHEIDPLKECYCGRPFKGGIRSPQ